MSSSETQEVQQVTKTYDKNGFLQKNTYLNSINTFQLNQKQQQRYEMWSSILPNLIKQMSEGKQSQKKIINLARQGIADSLRSQVWPLLIQNPLTKYQDCQWQLNENKDINLDLDRTFPTHKNAKQLQIKMKNVLNALVIAIPQLGYCQGMNFIVGTLLLRLDQQKAYNVAFHIFHWEKQQNLLRNLGTIHEKLYAFRKLLKKQHPQLYKILKSYQIDPLIYASSWFITMYTNTLPFCYVLRIIDSFLLEGEKILYRVGLQILATKKKKLKSLTTVESIMDQLKNFDQFNESNVDIFFKEMFKISLSRDQIKDYNHLYKQSAKKKQNE